MAKDGVTSKCLGTLEIRYLCFQDNIFGIWREEESLHIGNETNKIIIDMIFNDEKYKKLMVFGGF